MEIKYIDETHTYYLEGMQVPSVSQILKSYYNFSIPFSELEVAAKWGTAVHEHLAAYVQKILDIKKIDKRITGYLEKFDKLLNETQLKIIEIEKIVASKKWKYAGRIDYVCLNNKGEYCIVDIKTGMLNGRSEKIAGLQLGGYSIALKEMLKIRKINIYVFNITFDIAKVVRYDTKINENLFLQALSLYNLLNN